MGWKDFSDSLNKQVRTTFGVPCVFKFGLPEETSFLGDYNEHFELVDESTGMKVLTPSPNIFIRTADLPEKPKRSDPIIVNGVQFLVKEIHPDGQGGMVIQLYEQN